MHNKLLKMTNISKSFGSNKVLDGIEIEVGEGEVVALLGENGAGKSTLIKILGGIYHADGGELFIRKLCLSLTEQLQQIFLWGENIKRMV